MDRLRGAHYGRTEPRGRVPAARAAAARLHPAGPNEPPAEHGARLPESGGAASTAHSSARPPDPPEHRTRRSYPRRSPVCRAAGAAPLSHLEASKADRRTRGTAAGTGSRWQRAPMGARLHAPPGGPSRRARGGQRGGTQRAAHTYPAILPLPFGSFARGATRALSALLGRCRDGCSPCAGPSPGSGRCLRPSLGLSAGPRSGRRAAGRAAGSGGALCGRGRPGAVPVAPRGAVCPRSRRGSARREAPGSSLAARSRWQSPSPSRIAKVRGKTLAAAPRMLSARGAGEGRRRGAGIPPGAALRSARRSRASLPHLPAGFRQHLLPAGAGDRAGGCRAAPPKEEEREESGRPAGELWRSAGGSEHLCARLWHCQSLEGMEGFIFGNLPLLRLFDADIPPLQRTRLSPPSLAEETFQQHPLWQRETNYNGEALTPAWPGRPMLRRFGSRPRSRRPRCPVRGEPSALGSAGSARGAAAAAAAAVGGAERGCGRQRDAPPPPGVWGPREPQRLLSLPAALVASAGVKSLTAVAVCFQRSHTAPNPARRFTRLLVEKDSPESSGSFG